MKKLLLLIFTLTLISCLEETEVKPVEDTKINWTSKKVVFIGDSNTDEKYNPNVKYPTILNNDLKFKSFTNLGASGMAMSKINSGNYFIKSGGLLYTINWTNYDVVFISLGGNDLWQDVKMNAFVEAYHTAINHISSVNKGIDIILLNHPKHTRLTDKNSEGKSSIDFADAVIDIGKKYNLKTIDAWRNSGIELTNINKYLSDGVHMNAEGQALYASYLLKELR